MYRWYRDERDFIPVFLTYQGSPPFLSREGENGGLGDFLVSGGVQVPSDKLR